MATNIYMPKLGLTMTEGFVSKWLKSVGDTVNTGEQLVEIETDKITNAIEAPVDGVLLEIFADEGSTVEVAGLMAVIGKPGEKTDRAVSVQEDKETVPKDGFSEAVADDNSNAVKKDSEDNWIKASPAAKKLAKEMNIDLSSVKGTGPGGRIIERDILNHNENAPKVRVSPMAEKTALEEGIDLQSIKSDSRIMQSDVLLAASQKPAVSPVSDLSDSNGSELTGMRKVIAERMSASWKASPHVNMTYKVDMTEALELKNKMTNASDTGYSFTEIIVKAVAMALEEHTEINRSLINQQIYQHNTVNIGIAVALNNGLTVPVVKNAQNKSISILRDEISILSEKARKGELTPEEISGGTFTVSNLGMYGVHHFTPIINPPESAILGVCRIISEPVVAENEIQIRPMLNLCLSFDHRLIDGAVAAVFMKKIKYLLEQPYLLIL